MRKNLLCLVALLVTSQVSYSKTIADISIIELILSPNKYENKMIRVKGFLLHVPRLSLYLSKDHAGMFDTASAIRLAEPTYELPIENSKCNKGYVDLIGEIIKTSDGEYIITNVVWLYGISERTGECISPENGLHDIYNK